MPDSQKSEIERRIQEERDQFDRDLEEETQKKLEKIKEKSQQRSREGRWTGRRKKNQTAIDALKQEYEENHEIYAEEIVRHMIEV